MCVAKETEVVPCLANSAATGDRETIVESRLSINSSLAGTTYNHCTHTCKSVWIVLPSNGAALERHLVLGERASLV